MRWQRWFPVWRCDSPIVPPGDIQAVLSTKASSIATFTQRFFAR